MRLVLMYSFPENEDKFKERYLLLRRIFEGKILLAIEKNLGDDYCVKFDERGYDSNYNYFSEDEVAKRLAKILTDEQLLNISEKYGDKLSDLMRGVFTPLHREGARISPLEVKIEAEAEHGISKDTIDLKIKETLNQIGAKVVEEEVE